jgi:hypothetical protein
MFGMEHVPASGHDGRFVGAIGGSLGLAHGGVTALDPRSGPGVDLYADVGATFGRHGAGMRAGLVGEFTHADLMGLPIGAYYLYEPHPRLALYVGGSYLLGARVYCGKVSSTGAVPKTWGTINLPCERAGERLPVELPAARGFAGLRFTALRLGAGLSWNPFIELSAIGSGDSDVGRYATFGFRLGAVFTSFPVWYRR